MTNGAVPLSAVCEALGMEPSKVRTWATRGIIQIARGKSKVGHQLTGEFAMRLAIMAEVSKAATPPPATLWNATTGFLERLEAADPPLGTRIFYVRFGDADGQVLEQLVIGAGELVRSVEEAAVGGWQRFTAVEVGAAILKVCEVMQARARQTADA